MRRILTLSVASWLLFLLTPASLKAEVAPFEVTTHADLPYYSGEDADPNKHKLDLYVPTGSKNFPVLFFVHGGTWKSGDRKIYKPLGEIFASHGVATAIISYRLSPKVQHPAHVQDVARAFAWTHANVERYGGRPDAIVACGHSAGGHLVALLATDETYLKAEQRSTKDIRAILPISGVYRIVPLGALATAFGSDFSVAKKASPINHVRGMLPPFLILYADKDLPTLGPMAEELGKALSKEGTEAEVRTIADRDHVSIMTKLVKEDDPTRKAILEFVRKHTTLP